MPEMGLKLNVLNIYLNDFVAELLPKLRFQ